MRASAFVGTSLDGFIARESGAYDFLLGNGGGEPHGYDEFFATVDALVMGRNTYEVVAALPKWPYGEKPVYVLSSRPFPSPLHELVVATLSGSPRDVVARLEERGVRHAYVDGGITVQRFLRAGLLQRVTVTRVPVLIGTGIPLFGPTERDIPLRHVATRTYAGGAVQCEYEVLG
jgi:dihydrofolate reductase